MATIQCDSKTVIDGCVKAIENIKAERAKRDEKTIQAHMKKGRRVWRGFWFKREEFTRDAAIADLDRLAKLDMWFDWKSHYAWGDLDKIKKILLLAQHGDPVTLNDEDARAIWA